MSQTKTRLKSRNTGLVGLQKLRLGWEKVKEEIMLAAEQGEEFIVWCKTAEGWELALAAATAVVGGSLQDALSFVPVLGYVITAIGVLLGPIDEMLFGAPPFIVLFEFLRRFQGVDVLTWIREKVSWFPTWALIAAFGIITAILTAGDISMNLPIIGIVVWPGEMIDQYFFGLPSLLVAIELRNRLGEHAPKTVTDSLPAKE